MYAPTATTSKRRRELAPARTLAVLVALALPAAAVAQPASPPEPPPPAPSAPADPAPSRSEPEVPPPAPGFPPTPTQPAGSPWPPAPPAITPPAPSPAIAPAAPAPPPRLPARYGPYPRPFPAAWWRPSRRCVYSEACSESGLCSEVQGQCGALTDLDCMASRVCRKGGQCSAVGGRCAATHPAQCVWSERCALEKRCVLDAAAGRCDDGMRRNDPDLAIGGAALMGVGAASLMAGVVVGIMGTGSQISSGLSGRSASSSEVAVAALMIGGVVTAGLGVPLLLVGLRRVPREAPGAPPARRSAALRIDLGAATLRGEF